jgi:hypothetical protein
MQMQQLSKFYSIEFFNFALSLLVGWDGGGGKREWKEYAENWDYQDKPRDTCSAFGTLPLCLLVRR